MSTENKKPHSHWEMESECPQGHKNVISVPVGEKFVSVECKHCTHSKSYTHIVDEHHIRVVPDEK